MGYFTFYFQPQIAFIVHSDIKIQPYPYLINIIATLNDTSKTSNNLFQIEVIA